MEEIHLDKKLPQQEQLAIRIEIARPEDWEKFKQLKLESFTGEDAKMFGITPDDKDGRLEKERSMDYKGWSERLAGEYVFGVLAWSGSDAVGMGLAKRVGKDKNKEWYMYSGYIKPDFRGGIGKKLFAIRLNEIRNRGGKKVSVGVKTINARSIHIITSFGFKRVEEGSSDEGFYLELDDVNAPEVVKKIDEVLNAG